MTDIKKALEPFTFRTRLYLPELTGLRAGTLGQLLELIKTVPGASIYYHTHIFLQQHHYLFPKPANDFVYWINEILGEDELAEELASIDTVQFTSIRNLRETIVATIETYLKNNPSANLRFARRNEEFYFIKSVSFIFSTNYVAEDLEQFLDILNKITTDSIYFHIFEARLRLEKGSNDFSDWIQKAIGDKDLADRIAGLDPYSYSLEELRTAIIHLIRKRIS